MKPRIKKLVGSVGVLAFLAFYVWGAATLSERIPQTGFVRFAFFVCAGMLWGVPLLPFISWMNRESPPDGNPATRRPPPPAA